MRNKRLKASTHKPGIEVDVGDDPDESGKKRKAEYAKLYPDAETSPSEDTEASAYALAELKRGIDHLVPLMDHAAKKEASDYLLKKISEGS